MTEGIGNISSELGKIEKPEAQQFQGKRKLYLVPLLYPWEEAPADYVERFNAYWQQVKEHVSNLESKLSKVVRVYHESITEAGEDGLKVVEKINVASYQLVWEKCQAGAQFEVVEDRELSEESLDWERHLYIGFVSPKVAKTVSDLYVEASKKRYEYIARKINESLKEGEAALLFIREGHRVQFPTDIEVFSVAPPALDEIHRWLRDQPSLEETEEEPSSAVGETKSETKSEKDSEANLETNTEINPETK